MDFYQPAMPIVGYPFSQASPPQPQSVPPNVQFLVTPNEAISIMKPTCTPISIPIPSVSSGHACLELPTKLFRTLQKPPLQFNEDSVITTCSMCRQENTLLTIKLKEWRRTIAEYTELIDYLKKHIVFRQCQGGELPLTVSNNLSCSQATDLYKSSNLDANANEFTPSQKSKAAKVPTNDVSDHGTVESSFNSAVHDSGVPDSGILSAATTNSFPKIFNQDDSGMSIRELHQSTESLKKPNNTEHQRSKKHQHQHKKNSQRLSNDHIPESHGYNSKSNGVRGVASLPNRHNSYDKHERKNVESVVREVQGDLFSAGDDYSLAHCVAEDFRMGAGIAVHFRKEFGGVGELLDQRKGVGEVAFLFKRNRYIFYLITKRASFMKPTLKTIHSSIKCLRKLCEEHKVKKLAMPMIGCGLDRLNWDEVKQILNSEFQYTDMDIVVYHYKEELPNSDNAILKPKTPRIKENNNFPLVEIETNTALVVYGSLDGHVDETCKRIESRYPFMKKYFNACKESKLSLGEFFPIESNGEYVCIFIVRKTANDPFSFRYLEQGIQNFNKFLTKEKYEFVGIETVEDDDAQINEKIITVFRSCLSSKVELWVCNRNSTTKS